MELSGIKVVVISHAGIKQINRAVYRNLQNEVRQLILIIPDQLQLSAGKMISAEPSLPGDPEIVKLPLTGRNPRTYFYPDLILRLNEYRPDIVLLENDPVSRLGMQLTKWCKKNGSKIICQTYENLKRDLISTVKMQGWKAIPKNLIINLLNYAMAPKVDALLVVNKESESAFTRYGYRNVLRIPLGYDKTVFFPDGEIRKLYRQKMPVQSDTVVIAYFGRLIKQKGVHLLIQALRELMSFNWILLLDHIHDSEDRYVSYIQTLIKGFQLENRVIYFEADHFEIANYMRVADIMVAPSITTPNFKEQYGRAVQEAMACGCVCVVSDSGHLKDLVGQKSLVFKETDVPMLKNTIKNLLQDKEKRLEYKSYLTNRASSMLTTDSQSEQLAILMQKLVG